MFTERSSKTIVRNLTLLTLSVFMIGYISAKQQAYTLKQSDALNKFIVERLRGDYKKLVYSNHDYIFKQVNSLNLETSRDKVYAVGMVELYELGKIYMMKEIQDKNLFDLQSRSNLKLYIDSAINIENNALGKIVPWNTGQYFTHVWGSLSNALSPEAKMYLNYFINSLYAKRYPV